MKFLISLLLSAVAVFASAYLVPGVQIDGFVTALIVAIVLGLVNATIGFLLKLLTAPLNWITLGLVSLIINVLMVLLVDNFINGFSTNGFWAAAIFALVLAIIQSFLGVQKD
ncbi:phage holin family protein [Candidatus Gracilibacteria bacterium]|jgi:putative membrane protein|nr:phage holin family protein [Candidatus Gracilibacteria bacterium]